MARRVIILFEGSNSRPPVVHWKTVVSKMGCVREVTLFWISDTPYDSVVETLSKLGMEVDIIQAGPLLQREMQTFSGEIEDWLAGLEKHFSDIPDLWFSRISELNFTNPIWFDLVRFNIFESEIRSGRYSYCVAICGYNLHKMVSRLCDQNGISFLPKVMGTYRSNWLRLIIFSIAGWLQNLTTDVISLMLTRQNRKKINADIAVYTRFPNNWSNIPGTTFCRFTGPISRSLRRIGKSGVYFITISRRNQSVLKRVKTILSHYKGLGRHSSDMPVLTIESFGTFKDMFISYIYLKDSLKWFIRWLELRLSGKIRWRKVDISFLLKRDLLNTVFRDWPSNRYVVKCIKNAIGQSGIDSLVVPIFELVEGRAVVRAGNQNGVKTIGIQHGSAGLAHRWRIMTITGIMAAGNGRKPMNIPKNIGVEGHSPAKWFWDSGYPTKSIQIIGAPRLRKTVSEARFNRKSQSILFLGDLHRPQALFSWALNNLGNKKYQLVFRPHPSSYPGTVKWLSSQQLKVTTNTHISPRGSSLEDDLIQICPICLMVGCTGAAVDLALSGWPIIVVLSNWLPDYSPLTGARNSGILSSSDPAEVSHWLELLGNDLEYFTGYSQKCKDIARELIEDSGTASDKLLAKMI